MFFRNEYWFLSNFYPVEIPFGDGGDERGANEHVYTMPTAENAFQARKVLLTDLSYAQRAEMLAKFEAATPTESKGLGRTLKLDIARWNSLSESSMLITLRQKFKPGTDLADRLLATGNIEIVEDNAHGDTLWGRDLAGIGQNKLGVLLMQVRADLRAQR